ncbi:hypothetical protein [Bacteroides stercoris]|uniref:hypothetical protein n=1 Tax=Bacteroides stercoris TaxID=46506 RepID=UPI0020CB5096|nr:hypothetical protein [Bacteroides stercoris]
MAKKINTEEEPQKEGNKVAAPELPAEAIPEMSEKIPATVEDKRPVPAEKTGNTEDEVADPYILTILEKFPAYPSLYIDRHGGTYTPDTAATVRGGGCTLQKPFL